MLMMSESCVVLYGFLLFIYENSLIMIKSSDSSIFIKFKKKKKFCLVFASQDLMLMTMQVSLTPPFDFIL